MSTAGFQANEPVKLPSALLGALAPDISTLMVTTICWPMFGVALDGVAADATLPVSAVKLAVTVLAALIVTEQAPVPVHAPLHELNTYPAAGVAVTVTMVPDA